MSCSAKQKKSNTQNAQSSTGPKTESGKANSARNALKHGLRAEKLALPNEDPAEFAAREQEWADHYQPQNPGEAYLLHAAVRATIRLDRCARFETAELSHQVRSADHRLMARREVAIQPHLQALHGDANERAEGLIGLYQTGHGVHYLLYQWKDLYHIVTGTGFWSKDDLDWAKRLGGAFPDGKDLLAPEPEPPLLPWQQRERDRLAREAPAQPIPDIPAIRARVLAEIEAKLAELGPEEEMLRTTIDEPERAEIGERALMIEDPKLAGLVLRYQNAAQSTFFRALAALNKAIKERGEGEAPNEPSRAEEEPSNPCKSETCADAESPEPGPDGGAAAGPDSGPFGSSEFIVEQISLNKPENPAPATHLIGDQIQNL